MSSIYKSRNNIFILSMENKYMWTQYITYKDSLYQSWALIRRWIERGDQYRESLYVMYCLHIQLFSILKMKILFLLLAIRLILLSILCHVRSSIVCYCLYNVWIVVSRLFLLDDETWLIQIPIFEVKHCIWILILLEVKIVIIFNFLLKILVSHIDSCIKSPYIVKLSVCEDDSVAESFMSDTNTTSALASTLKMINNGISRSSWLTLNLGHDWHLIFVSRACHVHVNGRCYMSVQIWHLSSTKLITLIDEPLDLDFNLLDTTNWAFKDGAAYTSRFCHQKWQPRYLHQCLLKPLTKA